MQTRKRGGSFSSLRESFSFCGLQVSDVPFTHERKVFHMAKTNGSTQARDASKEERQRPAHEVRLGRIKGAIWANSTEQGVRYNVTLTRLYKDQESGEWRNSASFGRDDLLLVGKVSELAMEWIYEQSQTQNQDSDEIPY